MAMKALIVSRIDRDDALAFYALRKRVYAAYPIEWLGKCDI